MNLNKKGHELFISKMQDSIDEAAKRNRIFVTSFLSLSEQSILASMTPASIDLSLEGGYKNAERKRAVLSLYETKEAVVSCLESKIDVRFRSLSHRDILGALMNLGIERETIGDILFLEDRVVLFCLPSLVEYIQTNCLRAGKTNLDWEEIAFDQDFKLPREEIKINSASCRLDSIVSSLAHVSRAKAKAMIHQGLIKVNDLVLDENVVLCDNDFVSIRKIGRFQFKGIETTTKKERLILRFEKYI